MRLEGASGTIREAYPAEYVELAAFVTELGGTTVPMVLLAALFWLSRRRESALAMSYAVAGVGFLLAVKAVLAVPRPPEELYLAALDGDPYGFPSGHAFGATVVYGGVVSAFGLTRDRWAVLGAGAIVVLVSLSRVVLGFHYLGDVLAGIALGLAFLYAMSRWCRGNPRVGFETAVVLALPAIVLTGAGEDALLALGGAVGGGVAVRRLDDLPPLRSPFEGAVLVAVGGAFAVSMRALEGALATVEPALVALYAALVAGVVVCPAAVGRLGVGPLDPAGRSE